LWAPRAYALDGSMLIIRRRIGDVKIKFDDFQAVKRIENAGPLSGIRIFGVGGLFGYFGQFYLWGYGPVTGYATRLTGRLLIVTRQGKQIIITPDDRGFMDDLKKKLALQTYSLN
jgi:Bacterial PH domain